jgi:hypothetical protein
MSFDAFTIEVGMWLTQVLGLCGLCLGRMSLRGTPCVWLQLGYFACLLGVASVFFLGVGLCSPWWVVTGTTFAVMVVGTAWQVPGVPV